MPAAAVRVTRNTKPTSRRRSNASIASMAATMPTDHASRLGWSVTSSQPSAPISSPAESAAQAPRSREAPRLAADNGNARCRRCEWGSVCGRGRPRSRPAASRSVRRPAASRRSSATRRRAAAAALPGRARPAARSVTLAPRRSSRAACRSSSTAARRRRTCASRACHSAAACSLLGGTPSRSAHATGWAQDGRTVASRSYRGPAGARSPPKRSRVSRPHNPR